MTTITITLRRYDSFAGGSYHQSRLTLGNPPRLTTGEGHGIVFGNVSPPMQETLIPPDVQSKLTVVIAALEKGSTHFRARLEASEREKFRTPSSEIHVVVTQKGSPVLSWQTEAFLVKSGLLRDLLDVLQVPVSASMTNLGSDAPLRTKPISLAEIHGINLRVRRQNPGKSSPLQDKLSASLNPLPVKLEEDGVTLEAEFESNAECILMPPDQLCVNGELRWISQVMSPDAAYQSVTGKPGDGWEKWIIIENGKPLKWLWEGEQEAFEQRQRPA
jgi:hypothetical protein